MNKKLETIHQAFPFFIDGSFYITTPEDHFEDPDSQIIVSVWGEQYSCEFYGPGEYAKLIFVSAEEAINNVKQWLSSNSE